MGRRWAAAPHPPRRLRGRPHRPDTRGAVAGGGQGLRPGRGAQPLFLGDAVRALACGGSPPRGDGSSRTGRAPTGVRVHRTRDLHPEDVVKPQRNPHDLRSTADHGPGTPPAGHPAAASDEPRAVQALHEPTAARPPARPRQGRRGRARFARVLASEPPATRTELEDRVHDLVRRAVSKRPPSTFPSTSTAAASSPTSAGPHNTSSSRPTAASGTTTRRPKPTMPNARPSWKPTANASSASAGTKPQPARPRRSRGSASRSARAPQCPHGLPSN